MQACRASRGRAKLKKEIAKEPSEQWEGNQERCPRSEQSSQVQVLDFSRAAVALAARVADRKEEKASGGSKENQVGREQSPPWGFMDSKG